MMRQALRRAMACFLLAAVLSTAAVIPASAAGFRDVPSGHWAAESIERCVSLGFFQGKSASQFGMGGRPRFPIRPRFRMCLSMHGTPAL